MERKRRARDYQGALAQWNPVVDDTMTTHLQRLWGQNKHGSYEAPTGEAVEMTTGGHSVWAIADHPDIPHEKSKAKGRCMVTLVGTNP